MSYADGPIPVPLDDNFLGDNVQRICICDSGALFSFPLSERGLELKLTILYTHFLFISTE